MHTTIYHRNAALENCRYDNTVGQWCKFVVWKSPYVQCSLCRRLDLIWYHYYFFFLLPHCCSFIRNEITEENHRNETDKRATSPMGYVNLSQVFRPASEWQETLVVVVVVVLAVVISLTAVHYSGGSIRILVAV